MSKQSDARISLLDAAEAAAAFGAAAGAVDAAAAAAFGVNRTDLRMIGILHRSGSLTPGVLATECGLSPAATSTAIQRLVRAGHVTRAIDADDRRRAVVTLTPSAAKRLEAIYSPVAEAGMRQLAEYDAAELALLTDFLRGGETLQRKHADRIRGMK